MNQTRFEEHWRFAENTTLTYAHVPRDARDPVTGSYRSFIIREPKLRRISAPPFRFRVAHNALTRVLEPRKQALPRGAPMQERGDIARTLGDRYNFDGG